jgi:hypothetical protein
MYSMYSVLCTVLLALISCLPSYSVPNDKSYCSDELPAIEPGVGYPGGRISLTCFRLGFDCGTLAYPLAARFGIDAFCQHKENAGNYCNGTVSPWREWDGNEIPFNTSGTLFYGDLPGNMVEQALPGVFHVPRFVYDTIYRVEDYSIQIVLSQELSSCWACTDSFLVSQGLSPWVQTTYGGRGRSRRVHPYSRQAPLPQTNGARLLS